MRGENSDHGFVSFLSSFIFLFGVHRHQLRLRQQSRLFAGLWDLRGYIRIAVCSSSFAHATHRTRTTHALKRLRTAFVCCSRLPCLSVIKRAFIVVITAVCFMCAFWFPSSVTHSTLFPLRLPCFPATMLHAPYKTRTRPRSSFSIRPLPSSPLPLHSSPFFFCERILHICTQFRLQKHALSPQYSVCLYRITYPSSIIQFFLSFLLFFFPSDYPAQTQTILAS